MAMFQTPPFYCFEVCLCATLRFLQYFQGERLYSNKHKIVFELLGLLLHYFAGIVYALYMFGK